MTSIKGGPSLNRLRIMLLTHISTISTHLKQKLPDTVKTKEQETFWKYISEVFTQGLRVTSQTFLNHDFQYQAITQHRAIVLKKITPSRYSQLSRSFQTQLHSYRRAQSAQLTPSQFKQIHTTLKPPPGKNSQPIQTQSHRRISTVPSRIRSSVINPQVPTRVLDRSSPRSRLLHNTRPSPPKSLHTPPQRPITTSQPQKSKPTPSPKRPATKLTPSQNISKKSPFTSPQRGYKWRFKRYYPAGRWSWFKFHTDILSPVRTIFNWLLPLKWKARRFYPGRFVGYLPLIFTMLVYSWVLILLFERSRQHDTGWTHPELVNFGYFMKRDWIRGNQMHDVEIYRKRRKFKKLDGNRYMHEEDLRIDRHEMPRWKWMIPDRFSTPKGVWPLRSYVVGSPQYTDRKWLTRPLMYRNALQTKWNNIFQNPVQQAGRRKRALRLRGAGKYEYGGTAHHYYFPAVHDEQHYLQVPSSDYPAHILPDAGKY